MAPRQGKGTNKGILVAFHVSPDFYAALDAKAKQYGFQSASLLARAIVERDHDVPEIQIAMSRIGGAQIKIQRKLLQITAATIGSMTEEDLLGD